jgi:uncharacterized FAD-dependent dehydrogenase
MATESLADRVAKIRWEHTIDLGNGIITPGRESPEWIERVARRVGFRVEPLDIRGDRFIARLWKP